MATIKAFNTLVVATPIPEPMTLDLFSLLLCVVSLDKDKNKSAIILP
jgi:hypothetical protein